MRKMQDRFKFRAKLKGMDKWVYGAYLKMLPYQPYPVGGTRPLETEYKHLIITEGSADWGMPRGIAAYEVIPETVGQCIGLKDKNDNLLYENDIVTDGIDKYVIEWDKDEAFLRFWVREIGTRDYYTFEQLLLYEVIGNTYENPELLEVENGK